MPLRRALKNPATALVFLCFGTFAWFYQAGGWNANSRFDLTRAIVERGTSSIDAYRLNTGDLALRNGHYYSDKAPGLSWLCMPPVAVAQWMFGPPDSQESLGRRAYVATIFAVALPTTVAAVLMMLILGELGCGSGSAAAGATAWALASLALPYSTLLYGHQLAAALLVAGFWILLRARRQRTPASPLGLFCAGLLLGIAVISEYPAALAAGIIGVYAIATLKPRQSIVWLIAGGLVPGLALGIYNAMLFGGPFVTAYSFSTQKSRHLGTFMGLGAPRLSALRNLLFTQYRGIFYSMPWLLLVVPGAVMLWRKQKAETAVCAAIPIVFLVFNASLTDWQGGWAMGARYLIPALPFAAILATAALQIGGTNRTGRAVELAFGALVAYSFVMMLIGTTVKPEVPQWIDRPFTLLFRTFTIEDRVAINTQSIDEYDTRGGHRRAWNAGEILGLRGRASLAPLAVWIAATGAWLAMTSRRTTLQRPQ